MVCVCIYIQLSTEEYIKMYEEKGLKFILRKSIICCGQ